MGAAKMSASSSSLSFELTIKHTDSKNKKFYLEEYLNFESASPEEKQFLIASLAPTFRRIFKNESDLDMIIQLYVYNPHSINTILHIVKAKEDNQVKGFVITFVAEIYLLPNNKTNENRYIVSTAIGCVDKEYRNSGVMRDNYICKQLELYRKYPNCNLVHYDLSTQALPYYVICKTCKVFPRYCYESPNGVLGIINKMSEITGTYKYSKQNLFLAINDLDTIDDFREIFNLNDKNLPEDIRFFCEQTGLKENVGLLFLAVWNLVDGNTLGIPGGCFIKNFHFDSEIRSINFQKRTYKL